MEGKVCLVTGGSSGIGKAICEQFAQLGAKVSICDLDRTNGEKLCEEIIKKHGPGTAIFNQTDVAEMNSLRDAFKKTVDTLGGLDVVCNNAGIWDDRLSSWSKEIDINLKGVVNGCILAIEMMGTSNGGKGGTVINTSSVMGIIFLPFMPIYSATKAAVLSLTRCFGTEQHYELNGVRFMTVCPSGTDTQLFGDECDKSLISNKKMSEIFIALFTSNPPQKPESVAKCVVKMLEEGKNGSAWVSKEDCEPHLLNFEDNFENILKTDGLI